MDYTLVARVEGAGEKKFTPVMGILPELLLGDCHGPCFAFGKNSIAVCFECTDLAHLILYIVQPFC